jgi:hypothetical protein
VQVTRSVQHASPMLQVHSDIVQSALASLTPAQQERIDKLQDLVETYRRKVCGTSEVC